MAIDDISTGTGISSGWAYVVMDSSKEKEFEDKSKAILGGGSLKSFHGKEYKRKHKAKYIEFLKLVKEYTIDSDQSLISVTLLSEDWRNTFQGFSERLAQSSLQQNGINDNTIITALKHLAPPLFCLQFLTQKMGGSNSLEIKIDDHDDTRGFGTLNTPVGSIIGNIMISGQWFMHKIYNAYRKKQFPTSPELKENGIHVIDDTDSFLVQASDIIANFSTAYIYSKLGKTSNTIKEKVDIFDEVFGEEFGKEKFFKNVELEGDSDLKLKFEGQHTLRFGR